MFVLYFVILNYMTFRKNGFTLIELLVVVAIIGILTAIVLVSINISRAKGVDGAINKQLVEARSQAEVHYINNGSSYATLCTSGTSNISAMVAKLAQISGTTVGGVGTAQTATTTNCNSSVTAYALSVKLKQPTTPTYLCIDSTNRTRQTTTPLSAGATVCP